MRDALQTQRTVRPLGPSELRYRIELLRLVESDGIASDAVAAVTTQSSAGKSAAFGQLAQWFSLEQGLIDLCADVRAADGADSFGHTREDSRKTTQNLRRGQSLRGTNAAGSFCETLFLGAKLPNALIDLAVLRCDFVIHCFAWNSFPTSGRR
jgi:hypothetical protein